MFKGQFNKLANFSFGGTSAIITNMSIIIGLGSTDMPKSGIIGGLLIIAVADNISDSLGIHIYKESEACGVRESFLSTTLNFLTRLFISLCFILAVVYLPMQTAQIISVILGLLVISLISYFISRNNKQRPFLEILKHIAIAVAVISASKYIGVFIHGYFEK